VAADATLFFHMYFQWQVHLVNQTSQLLGLMTIIRNKVDAKLVNNCADC